MTEKFAPKIGTIYEFTYCPSDSYQFADKKDARLKNAVDHFKHVFSKIDARVHMFCEVSMPQYGDIHKQRYGRIHWHGIILFSTDHQLRDFYVLRWHQLTAKGKIQLNEYRPEWDEYCRKQKALFPNWTRIKNASWQAIINLASCPTIDEESDDDEEQRIDYVDPFD